MDNSYDRAELRVEYKRLQNRIIDVDRDIAVIERDIRDGSNGDDLPSMKLAMAHKEAMEAHMEALTNRMKWLGVELPE